MTGETIHRLQDEEMYSTFERGIRGGLAFTNRHSCQSHHGAEGNIHLVYIDQNNLYGSALCKPLPYSNFSWIDEVDIEYFQDPNHILSLDDEGDVGYLFEVDLIYPSEIHDETADFPLAPESGEVTKDMFSPHMSFLYKNIAQASGKSENYKPCRKLLLTQFDKEAYVCHFTILKFYLNKGMVLKNVRRGIRFNQKRFLEPYIKYNSERRAQSRNSFEKDFYKLKNNCLFGKTMEDVRKRRIIKLVTDPLKLEKLVNDPMFYDRDVINDEISAVHMIKPKVVLDKPVYVGKAVLDYSKLEMYRLFYDTLRPNKLLKKVELLGGDTDSFFLALHTDAGIGRDDIFRDLRQFQDISNYPSQESSSIFLYKQG